MQSENARVVLLLFAVLVSSPGRAAEFCADLKARYGAGIMRCVDFAIPIEAAINSVRAGKRAISTHLFNGSMTATPGTSGSLYWKIRSYDQVRAEEPTLSKGAAWLKAVSSHTGNWQRWIGVDRLTPGQTYFYQFKLRFNAAYKTQWGGGGPKVFGMDAGCRTVNGVSIPPVCERFNGDYVTDLGTAGSMEFATMTTTNWYPSSVPGAANRPYPIMYQGSSNFALTRGFTPNVFVPTIGVGQLEQPGPDSGWEWNGTAFVKTCDSLSRKKNPDFVVNGPCVTYGAPDVWHEITIALRPSGNYYDTNPAATKDRVLRHDTLLKVWYDGQLIINFDPNARPLRAGQPSASECAAKQTILPAHDDCRTGVDIFRDSRDVPPNSAWCVASCGPGDPGADLTQFLLWTFSWRRGFPPSDGAWCDSEVRTGAPEYGACRELAQSGPPANAAAEFEAFLHHKQVDVYMDDWVVATVPLPMKKRPAGAQLGAGSFGLDARDLDMLPPNTWTRLYPGPDKTFYNTGYGRMAANDPYNPTPGAMPEAHVTAGVSTLSATNYGIEIPVQSGVPLGGGFVGTPYGNGKMLYFGGGHSGYRANRVYVWDLNTGRWSQSKYTPDMGSQVAGALGGTTPTPPGIGCKTAPFNGPATGRYFSTTGNLTAGSKVVTGIAAINNMCPIKGACPGQGAQTGGYGIFATGIPAEAAILSVDGPNQITMTHAATVTATGVALTGGKPTCEAGGSPNGSTGGRGWWEHMDNRYNWDERARAWMLVQASGTWLYDDVKETWQRASGPHAGAETLLCGGSDYTALSTTFSPELNRTLAWCSTGGIFGYDYGSGPPNYTGAKWMRLHQIASNIQNPHTDVLGQAVWNAVSKKLFYLSSQTTGMYGGTGVADPAVYWFDPFAAPACTATTTGQCGKSGKLDNTKANFPQGYFVPIDATTQRQDTSSPCYKSICQSITASLAVDKAGSLYVAGRRAGDGQIALWKATDPLGPNEAWTVLQNFHFNTYDSKGLRLLADKPPNETEYEFSVNSSTMGMLNYIPERDAFILITRSGSGNGGASTRGTGDPKMGGCYLNGVADDCFRMYGLRLAPTK